MQNLLISNPSAINRARVQTIHRNQTSIRLRRRQDRLVAVMSAPCRNQTTHQYAIQLSRKHC